MKNDAFFWTSRQLDKHTRQLFHGHCFSPIWLDSLLTPFLYCWRSRRNSLWFQLLRTRIKVLLSSNESDEIQLFPFLAVLKTYLNRLLLHRGVYADSGILGFRDGRATKTPEMDDTGPRPGRYSESAISTRNTAADRRISCARNSDRMPFGYRSSDNRALLFIRVAAQLKFDIVKLLVAPCRGGSNFFF